MVFVCAYKEVLRAMLFVANEHRHWEQQQHQELHLRRDTVVSLFGTCNDMPARAHGSSSTDACSADSGLQSYVYGPGAHACAEGRTHPALRNA